jgi:RNA polymerase sigma-70 factor (ECF subfamily)
MVAMMNANYTAQPVTMVADDELIAKVRVGDQEAFATLVDRYKRPVYNLAYRLLGNPNDAEDAAQETFVRAYTRLATYEPDGRLQTVALGKVTESDRFISQVDGPEEVALVADSRDEVQRWLDALPPQYRTVLSLRYFQDLSYAEIADVLDEPVSTVRMRLFRARAMLQQVVARARAQQAAMVTPRMSMQVA